MDIRDYIMRALDPFPFKPQRAECCWLAIDQGVREELFFHVVPLSGLPWITIIRRRCRKFPPVASGEFGPYEVACYWIAAGRLPAKWEVFLKLLLLAEPPRPKFAFPSGPSELIALIRAACAGRFPGRTVGRWMLSTVRQRFGFRPMRRHRDEPNNFNFRAQREVSATAQDIVVWQDEILTRWRTS
ncbi:hypothetical protein E0H36_17410 [Rhizobium leguminosarum bv. viciae]|uniref:hypothetical protein n=1 Tax=Rhizobium leguminosarum TaxID=384 RepID=UPI001038830D|nr:hypothetical protein [Rhizobium leguminosarum]MBY5485409.1 hypothetical protein [Rhizobium leguminosarum]TBZ31054.1 hypothetical protein E0H36_17410 [Rhizobium leguminosarum bv. viciae]TBZ52125.1 hypothetical protein E0H44_04815 [Rhizobium leguminosarum bv. viciae]